MINLVIGNSYSTIRGLSPDQDKKLRDELSYVVGGKAAFYSRFGPRRKSLLDKKGGYPTGLHPRVLGFLSANNLLFQISTLTHNVRPALCPIALPINLIPYESQKTATSRAVYHGRGTIAMPTGTGKSLVIAMICHAIGLKTLVVVPSIEIRNQLRHNLKDLKNVTVMNIDSVASHSEHYDCLIIDESHHVAAKTYQKLNKTAWTGIFYRFFLTATPFRNDDEETLLFESIAGQVIYRLDYATAIKQNYIVPIEGYYIEIPKQETDAYTYAQVYSQLVVNNIVRNATISKLLINLQNAGKATLCLVREIEHGKILSAMTGIPFVSGEDDASRNFIRQFNSGVIMTVIGTTGILGEGIDTKPCEYVVIAGLGKAKSQFMQQVGRAVRKYPGKESAKVIIVKDKSHKFLTRHYNAQRAILREEYGALCSKLEIE